MSVFIIITLTLLNLYHMYIHILSGVAYSSDICTSTITFILIVIQLLILVNTTTNTSIEMTLLLILLILLVIILILIILLLIILIHKLCLHVLGHAVPRVEHLALGGTTCLTLLVQRGLVCIFTALLV